MEHARVTAAFATATGEPILQPNPWNEDTKSKKFLVRVTEAYKGTASKKPATQPIVDACKTICSKLAGVEFEEGGVKAGKRALEKSLSHGGHFNRIHDYARGAVIIRVRVPSSSTALPSAGCFICLRPPRHVSLGARSLAPFGLVRIVTLPTVLSSRAWWYVACSVEPGQLP